ncbi:MAG: hypothetical protein F4030_01620 [Gammaproteobacteria bacterium]|nr:hypothetical protein [Gammaproteobacteria bacterium]MYH87015.1 hypothetical protein [Gammaproteobacteria bacterium]MYK03671.1 hypothetical protein [Gammaproteobacteria bacterium]
MNGEVNLVVAHPLEAKALIDWFGLGEVEPRGEFRCHENMQGIALVISGMGVRNAANAVGRLHERQSPGFRAWLNVGIAGHPIATVGQGFLVNRIEHRRSGEYYWPPIPDLGLPGCGLVTVDKPETTYGQDAAFDMEAAGFFAAAAGLTTTDLVNVFKIISDNRENPVSEVSPKHVPELFRKQESAIRKLVDHLRERSAAFADWYGMPAEFESLLRSYRFSATRKAVLAQYCRRFRALGRQDRLSEIARGRFRDAASLMTAMRLELARTNEPGKTSRQGAE